MSDHLQQELVQTIERKMTENLLYNNGLNVNDRNVYINKKVVAKKQKMAKCIKKKNVVVENS